MHKTRFVEPGTYTSDEVRMNNPAYVSVKIEPVFVVIEGRKHAGKTSLIKKLYGMLDGYDFTFTRDAQFLEWNMDKNHTSMRPYLEARRSHSNYVSRVMQYGTHPGGRRQSVISDRYIHSSIVQHITEHYDSEADASLLKEQIKMMNKGRIKKPDLTFIMVDNEDANDPYKDAFCTHYHGLELYKDRFSISTPDLSMKTYFVPLYSKYCNENEGSAQCRTMYAREIIYTIYKTMVLKAFNEDPFIYGIGCNTNGRP